MKKRAASRKNMTMMNIALENDIHRRLALISFEENIAIAELVRQAVTAWLNQRPTKTHTRRTRRTS